MYYFDNSQAWTLKHELTCKENLKPYEEQYLSDFNYWDNVDCSGYGICLILAKYFICRANDGGYFYADADKLCNEIDKIRKDLV